MRACLLVLCACVLACEPDAVVRPQWVVHIGTDAPLPGFGDRVRVDVLAEDGSVCPECSRVFDIQGGASLPLSFGVLPDGAAPRFVRARLHRAENTTAAGDPADPLIDVLGELPALGDEPIDVVVLLGMECFGRSASLEQLTSCDPASGADVERLAFGSGEPEQLPLPGSWGGGDQPCTGEAPLGMVCVEGGAFLLGSRAYAPFGPDFDPVPEQLVRLAPFFLDVDELTVEVIRPLIARGLREPAPASDEQPHCAYTQDPGPNESASVNCIDRATAAAACQELGKRLPTEAEWEYAAGNRSAESPFPWAQDGTEPTTEVLCEKAIVARAEISPNGGGSRQCVLIGAYPVGPQPGGSAADVSPLGLHDLAGNLSEWVADDFARYSDATCWGTDVALHEQPSCVADPSVGVLRGGSWTSITYDTHVYFRRPAAIGLELEFVGVRCAHDAR